MLISDASLQVGNMVSLIGHSKGELPKPLIITHLFTEMLYLKGLGQPFLRSQVHFLKITGALLFQLGFREVSGLEVLKAKRRRYTFALDSPVGPSEATFIISNGMTPNATFELDGMLITSGKNWIHECQNAYYKVSGRMIEF